MPPSAANSSQTSAASRSEPATLLTWRVHLLRRQPQRLPGLLCVLFFAVACVWLMFRHPLPALAAALALVGATGEYLFPITYRLTEEGVFSEAPLSRLTLRWKDVRRLVREPTGIVLTPLAVPSRLDAFRGVLLRFAPEGEPGDRASTLAVVARCAPNLLEAAEETPTGAAS